MVNGGPDDTCMMAVMADYKFYVEHGANKATVASFMLSSINFADTIFRATNFGGITQVGVGVAKVTLGHHLTEKMFLFLIPIDYCVHDSRYINMSVSHEQLGAAAVADSF